MMMYGQDTAKAWWQMEQAFTAGMMLYDVTGNDQYLRMADETVDFFMKYFVDHVYGEVFSDRTRRGAGIPAWGNDKGNGGKGGYHSTEFGYYVYMYGKLLLRHEPVTLHYRFIADTTDRTFRMNPLAWGSGYRIGGVTLNGAPYADFDPGARTIHLPPGAGGHCSVVYEPVTAGVAAGVRTPAEFALDQNYRIRSTRRRRSGPGSGRVPRDARRVRRTREPRGDALRRRPASGYVLGSVERLRVLERRVFLQVERRGRDGDEKGHSPQISIR